MRIKVRKITECAVMVSLATVLSFISVYKAPSGGSVTLGSMVPLILVAIHIRDFRWGLLACFAYSILQMMLEPAFPPAASVFDFLAVMMLDYVVAFSSLCIANPVSKIFKNKMVGAGVGAGVAVFCRFLCHLTTGIIIWGAYAPPGQPVWIYSLLYNGGYMLPELIITVILSVVVYAVMLRRKQ